MNFQSTYKRNQYINFFRNQFLPEDFEEHDEDVSISFKPQRILKVVKIGEVQSLDLNVYEIEHESEYDPRVLISRDSFRFLAHYGVQKALIIFTSKNSQNFRLSLVTVDLIWDEGKKVKKEYSNPRRYSFFLGPDTKIHTPEEYLVKKGRVKDFEDLKNRFSIEVVNKEFYTQIAILFTKLAGGTRKIGKEKWDEKGLLKLPSTIDDTLKKEFTVRLIGRLVFCWFLKKKKSDNGISLLPEELLSSESISKSRNFYHSVLEPLFFAALNTPIEERSKKYNKLPWSHVPFLNGGLFNPGGHDYYDTDSLGTSKYLNTLKVPDVWLKKLFEVFETYNFTIDENTSIDVELSIEPEMLGRIFENLLAEINPETGETARKSTGSYYTPRPIVEYMVDQSLKQYLLTKTDIKEEKISSLLSYEDEKVELTDAQKERVLDALDNIKIIDPACGSGAFPMGILQKMLLILQKVDPESKNWLGRQVAKIDNKVVRKEVEKKLKKENWNYVHKRGIIQDSIYGVDIQPIAVEISKLRFFLSLVVDEKINDKEYNRGVASLPNLEFKFIAANSLIGLPEYKKEETVGLFEATDDIAKLKELRDSYFTSYGEEKKRIEKEFEETQKRMFQHSIDWQTSDSQTMQLSQWNPFSDDAATWFNSDWMFGVEDGFDVVIANPPYIQSRDGMISMQEKERLYKTFETAEYQLNTYGLFIEKGFKLLRENGHIAYIIPNYWLSTKYDKALREFVFKKNSVKELINLYNVFETATVDTLLLIGQFRTGTYPKSFIVKRVARDIVSIQERLKALETGNWGYCKDYIVDSPTEDVVVSFSDSLKLKGEHKLADFFVFKKGMQPYEFGKGVPPQTKEMMKGKIYDAKTQHDSSWQPLLKARNIKRYKVDWHGDWIKYGRNLAAPRDPELFKGSRILIQRIISNKLSGCYTDKHFICNTDVITLQPKDKYSESNALYFLGILLSSVCVAYLKSRNINLDRTAFPKINVNTLESFPLHEATDAQKASITERVKKILNNPDSPDVPSLEKEIDQLVYKLYDLTPEEIAIVER